MNPIKTKITFYPPNSIPYEYLSGKEPKDMITAVGIVFEDGKKTVFLSAGSVWKAETITEDYIK